MKTNIRPLKKADDRDGFSCGELELDYFFAKFAGQNQFKHYIGVTYVAEYEAKIVGFATISVSTLLNSQIDNKTVKNLPKYPLPVLKISRLAVDRRYQNQGIGKQLLKAMFYLALEQKKMFGCVGVIVDAKEEAQAFHRKLGFAQLQNQRQDKKYRATQPMFLAITTIQKALG